MISINRAEIGGYLGKDPEARKTTSGASVCSFSVAASEVWKDKEGIEQKKTEWVSVVVWGKGADNCAKYLKKGSPVLVEGRIQTRDYEADGVKKYKTEIVATRVHFLSVEKSGGNHAGNDAPEYTDNDAPPPIRSGGIEDDLPF